MRCVCSLLLVATFFVLSMFHCVCCCLLLFGLCCFVGVVAMMCVTLCLLCFDVGYAFLLLLCLCLPFLFGNVVVGCACCYCFLLLCVLKCSCFIGVDVCSVLYSILCVRAVLLCLLMRLRFDAF